MNATLTPFPKGGRREAAGGFWSAPASNPSPAPLPQGERGSWLSSHVSRLVSFTPRIIRIRVIELAACVPLLRQVAPGRHAAGVLQHCGEMHEIPRHERGVALGEVVLRSARAFVEIRRPRPRRAYPACIRLR